MRKVNETKAEARDGGSDPSPLLVLLEVLQNVHQLYQDRAVTRAGYDLGQDGTNCQELCFN